MQNTLSEMWKKYDLLMNFKVEMNKRGYASKDLYCLHSQVSILIELIDVESKIVLENWLKRTYFRLLKRINRGIEYLPDIVENPDSWILNKIENDLDAWIDKDVMIFTTKSGVLAFSKISRKSDGYSYIDGKYQ